MVKPVCRPCLEELIKGGRIKESKGIRDGAKRKDTCENCGRRCYCYHVEVKDVYPTVDGSDEFPGARIIVRGNEAGKYWLYSEWVKDHGEAQK